MEIWGWIFVAEIVIGIVGLIWRTIRNISTIKVHILYENNSMTTTRIGIKETQFVYDKGKYIVDKNCLVYTTMSRNLFYNYKSPLPINPKFEKNDLDVANELKVKTDNHLLNELVLGDGFTLKDIIFLVGILIILGVLIYSIVNANNQTTNIIQFINQTIVKH